MMRQQQSSKDWHVCIVCDQLLASSLDPAAAGHHARMRTSAETTTESNRFRTILRLRRRELEETCLIFGKEITFLAL